MVEVLVVIAAQQDEVLRHMDVDTKTGGKWCF
jgi:hypothetical protein